MRPTVRFIRRSRLVELVDVPPTLMLLDYLRENEGATGTKEGCREGDCGACTVALGRVRDGKIVYEPINSCIALLGQVDGSEVVTVEDLVQSDGTLHPVQQALVEYHGSQCGFCTPGFVMAIFALWQATGGPVTRDQVNDWIAGNLCRCTGYRPIVDAAISASAQPRQDRFRKGAVDMAGVLTFLADGEDVFVGDENAFFAAPTSLDSLADLYAANPDATLVAGATDVGLWITKQMRDLAKVIYVGKVKDFDRIDDTADELIVGAGATYTAVEPHISRIDPDLGELIRRLGSKQVRAAGTVGGNIANGSPIGDMPPALIALGARLVLASAEGSRELALEDFFIAYGEQDLRPGECLAQVVLPLPLEDQQFRTYKLSKRIEQDISAVCAAFCLRLNDEGISEARVAFGGMAETPRRAPHCEARLQGPPWNEATLEAAMQALDSDFEPITDMRASAAYRLRAARNLLRRFFLETT
ncbi:MAG: xanthine dehydrogenase small subunit, partial [Bauldia sp.]